MNPKSAITRMWQLMNQIGKWARPFWDVFNQDTSPNSGRDGSFNRFAARDRGQWYLHTVLGR